MYQEAVCRVVPCVAYMLVTCAAIPCSLSITCSSLIDMFARYCGRKVIHVYNKVVMADSL